MKKSKVTPRVISTVWRHWSAVFRKNGVMIGVSALCYSATLVIDVLFKPMQWKHIFDALSGKQYAAVHHYFLMIIASALAGWFLSRIGEYCIVMGESRIIKQLRDYCMTGLLTKSTDFFTKHSSGGLVAKSKRFAGTSETVIDEFIFSIIRSVLLVTCILAYSSIAIPGIAPVFAAWIALYVLAATSLSRLRVTYDLQSSTADSTTTEKVSDTLLSIQVLRVFTAIPSVYASFLKTTDDERAKRQSSWFIGNVQWAIQGAFFVVLEIWCMSTALQKTEQGIYTIGTIAMIQSYIGSLSAYMYGFGRSLMKVRTAFAESFEMAELLDQPNVEPFQIRDTETGVTPKHNGIELSNVSFSYKDGQQLLKNISFEFVPGRKYGIVGKTGSGKSTLIKLILQAYHHQRGTIHVCGHDNSAINKLLLRSWISYVPQDPQFPSWTIRDIISLGKPGATDEEIHEAAQKAHCDFILTKTSHGYGTIIGERGIKLSGGERQRLAIAAAILKQADIVIMDEPTSALDAKTESMIQEALTTHFSGKTMIVIAHRLSTVAILDEILIMKHGAIKETGSHHSLLETSAEYSMLWKLQTEPSILV